MPSSIKRELGFGLALLKNVSNVIFYFKEGCRLLFLVDAPNNRAGAVFAFLRGCNCLYICHVPTAVISYYYGFYFW